MSHYLVLHTSELSHAVVKLLEIDSEHKITPIDDNNGNVTDLHVALDICHNRLKELKQHRRFDGEEILVALDLIKQNQNVQRFILEKTRPSAFRDSEGCLSRLQGAVKFTITAGNTESQELLITEQRMLMGLSFKADGSNYGDMVDFEIMETIDGADVSINDLVTNWYVCDTKEFVEIYSLKLVIGLKIKVTYNNVGASDVDFYANAMLHKG